MLKSYLNTNIIPHIWTLANIVPIPKPDNDIDKGTSYRPIFLLSVIAETLERTLTFTDGPVCVCDVCCHVVVLGLSVRFLGTQCGCCDSGACIVVCIARVYAEIV